MQNSNLPTSGDMPEGEPSDYKDQVSLCGLNDRTVSTEFCDSNLNIWSAPIENQSDKKCYGDSYYIRPDIDILPLWIARAGQEGKRSPDIRSGQ